MLKLSMITDEVTQDLKEAIQLAKRLNMQGLELRSVEDTTIGEIPIERLKAYKAWMDEENLKCVSLASPLCKCVYSKEAIEKEKERLERLLDTCDIMDTTLIRAFAFVQNGEKDDAQMLAETLRPFAQRAHERGKVLCFEADPSVNTTNHAQLANLLEKIDHPAAGAIFDPGNCVWDPAGETAYPDGYMAIAPYIRHVHIKDGVRFEDRVDAVCIGTGHVDYSGFLKALKNSGYDGFCSMETHYRKASQLNEEMLQRPGGAAFSVGGLEAMLESTEALVKMFEEA